MELRQAELLGDAINGAREFLAEGIRRGAELGGDLRPFESGPAQVDKLLFLGGHALTDFGEQILVRGHLGRAVRGIHHARQIQIAIRGHPPLVPLLRPQPPNVIEQLVAGHRDQHCGQIAGMIQVVFPHRHADEEIGEDRLADVGRIEHAAQAGIGQSNPDRPANLGQIAADKFFRGGLLTTFNLLQEVAGITGDWSRFHQEGWRCGSGRIPGGGGILEKTLSGLPGRLRVCQWLLHRNLNLVRRSITMSFQTSIASFSRLFLLGLVAAVGSAAGAEPEKAGDSPIVAAPQFTIWEGGCSRSLKVLETHTDIHTALRAAERLKQQGTEVMVLSGESDWNRAFAVLLHQRKAPTSTATVEITVYEKVGCRLDLWRPINPDGKTDPKTVDEVLAKGSKNGTPVAAVYHVRK